MVLFELNEYQIWLQIKVGRKLGLRQFDLIAIWTAAIFLVAVCWWYLIDMAQMMESMANMAMPDMINTASNTVWRLSDFWSMFVMWAIMMIAMMVPTAMRTLMIYARIAGSRSTKVISPTYLFMFGYIVVWSIFSTAATLLQWQLDQADLLSPMLTSTSYSLGAFLLISAGIYQLLPIKNACLQHCQSPVGFISTHFKSGYWGAFAMGFHHGIFCLGCCWMLMLLLFLAGVMNLLWILVISLFVVLEKLLPFIFPHGTRFSTTFTGAALISAGGVFLLL